MNDQIPKDNVVGNLKSRYQWKKTLDLETHVLPIDSDSRKGIPLFSGCLNYFPLALAAVARHSRMGNDKHNPGQPLHWSRGRSADHADCIARHLVDHLSVSLSGEYEEARALAWRSLALLQELEEQRLSKPVSRGSRVAAPEPVVHVAVAVLLDKRGRVFLQRRNDADENFPGCVECPGGGVEPGESDYEAICRELREELGVRVVTSDAAPIWRGQIEGYRGRKFDFRFYRVLSWIGAPRALDGQKLVGWKTPSQAAQMALTPANRLAWDAIDAAASGRRGRR